MMKLKAFVARILQSDLVGGAIRRVSRGEISYYGGVKVPVRSQKIKNNTVGAVYFGLYEKSEAKMITRHLRSDLPTIEMGASLGFISSVVGKKCRKAIIGLEPNKTLREFHSELMKYNAIHNYKLVNAAYSATRDKVSFVTGTTNLHGRVTTSDTIDAQAVPGRSIRSLLMELDSPEMFQLVCDIEGGEVELILRERGAMKQCALAIIELHQTTFDGRTYEVHDIVDLYEACGLKRIDQRGRVVVFVNESIQA